LWTGKMKTRDYVTSKKLCNLLMAQTYKFASVSIITMQPFSSAFCFQISRAPFLWNTSFQLWSLKNRVECSLVTSYDLFYETAII
jgi:hypothetical protein